MAQEFVKYYYSVFDSDKSQLAGLYVSLKLGIGSDRKYIQSYFLGFYSKSNQCLLLRVPSSKDKRPFLRN